MFGIRFFKPRVAVEAGQALFESAVAQARTPAFYSDWRAPDTPLGRFELYTLHVVLLVRRLKGRSEQGRETVQALFDAYLLNLDIALREMGIGDLSMGKKMKKLGRAFYGRVKSWDEALDDAAAGEALALRTVYEGVESVDPRPLLDYVRRASAQLDATDDQTLLSGQAHWPQVIL